MPPTAGCRKPWSKPSEDQRFSSHRRDTKHEEYGVARNRIDIEDAEEKVMGLLSTVARVGADILRKEMASITETDSGYVEC